MVGVFSKIAFMCYCNNNHPINYPKLFGIRLDDYDESIILEITFQQPNKKIER